MAGGYLIDENGEPFTSATFDWEKYLLEQVEDPRLLELSEGRIALTRLDPLLFALIYCREVIKNDQGEVSFSDLHLDLCRTARTWVKKPVSKESRHAYIAPRGGGKSSWAFKILILWAGAHRHVKFAAAFSNSSTQAHGHLAGLRQFMDASEFMIEDYPDFCEPKRRPNGNVMADSQEMTHRKNQFSFAARGIDSGVLGLVDPDNARPELILLDDIEPDESNYSEYECRKRLLSVQDTILPMKENAHVVWIGTVTMPESLTHQMVKSVTDQQRPASWIGDEAFKVHYIPAIITLPDGSERSFWEGRFPYDRGSPELGGLKYDKHKRAFKKNMQNLPVSENGEYWDEADIRYGKLDDITKTLIQIDPAVTDKKSSDYTAFSVISYQPGFRSREGKDMDRVPMCVVRHVEQVRLPPAELRSRVLRLLERFPEARAVRIEANQGGDTWKSVFHDLPVPLLIHKESVAKKIRAEQLLSFYQRGRVIHEKHFPDLEAQMLAFPHVPNDDLIDSVGAGVHYFLKPKGRVGVQSMNYTRTGR